MLVFRMQERRTKLLHFANIREKLENAGRLGNTLLEKGHPYGLLLLSSPALSASWNIPRGIDDPIVSSSYLSSGVGFSELLGVDLPSLKKREVRDVFSTTMIIGSSAMQFSGPPPVSFSSSAGLSSSSAGARTENKRKATAYYSLGAALMGSSALASSSPWINQTFARSFIFPEETRATLEQWRVVVATPSVAGSLTKEGVVKVATSEPQVSEQGVSLGSFSTKVIQYNGGEPYIVRKESGEQVAEVQPGQRMLILHVNRNAKEYSSLSPLERVRKIRSEFINLCRLLKHPEDFPLDREQQDIVRGLKDAPLIGVSHLVRLLDTKGVDTWNIGVLPKPLQWLHAKDSQMVSRLFGGKRRIKPSDVKVTFVLPGDITRLVATA